MPTGYTADLTTFDAYLLRCARNFGACIEQRDDNMDTPPKLRSVSRYYEDRLVELNDELVKLRTGSKSDLASKWLAEQIDTYTKAIDKAEALRTKYTAMLQEVDAWIPPTEEHQGLKSFMASQLRTSIDFDCNVDYYTQGLEDIQALSLEEIHQKLVLDCVQNINFTSDQLEKEINSVNRSNKWIMALWESINESS